MKSRLAAPVQMIVQYFQGAYQEFRQVAWPTRQQVIQYTILVTITIVICTLLLTGFDYVFQQLTNRYLIR